MCSVVGCIGKNENAVKKLRAQLGEFEAGFGG